MSYTPPLRAERMKMTTGLGRGWPGRYGWRDDQSFSL
jgi:hypothetical protein